MCRSVNALAREVDASWVPLVVDFFELFSKYYQMLVGLTELETSDMMLVDETYSADKSAEIPSILWW